ncbi:MAG: peptidoglycan-binding domain-containing protein [Candidatus Liptonbacteria bacterium]|nr:peptidoglycan-binding domain-containing protein [Candidatus Liptonbacteria bacterium]
MSKLNKLVSVALTTTTFAWAVGVAIVPVASAQTTADLQAQIAALLAQIQQLQAKLGASSGASASYNFTRDLTVGSTGSDVLALQQFLNGNGALVAGGTGAGSPGNETSYFGSLTKAALSQWQGAHGVAPAVGYFGPITRAAIRAMAVSPSPSPSGTPTPAPVAGTGLMVGLGSNNPAAGSLISPATGNGAARTIVLGFSLSAGAGSAVNVSAINFHKAGVMSDSSVNGAYITRGGQVIAQYNSLSSGVISFSGLNINLPAGQTVDFGLAIDVAGGIGAGNTVSFNLSGSDVMSSDASGNAIVASGAASGNIFTATTVSNPSIASLTIASTSIANSVTAGTTNNIVGAWTFTVQNSKSWLQSVNFRVIGSANKSDLRNVKLMVNGSQVGNTLATVDANGNAYFDATAAPGTLNTGANNIQVYADVMGSPSYNFQFQILNSYDVLVVDSQYNVPILASSNAGTQVTILQGTVTVSQNSGTPTGQIAVGQSGVTLAKFNFYAGGEAVRIKFLGFSLAFTGTNAPTSTTLLAAAVKNISLIDDAGGQIGSTISTPPSSNGNATAGGCDVTGTALSGSNTTYTDCFGTSSSNVNYVVPANTTRVLSLKADIQSTANFATVLASLLTQTANNIQGLTSSQLGTTSGAGGSALTLSSNLLTVTQNNALGNQNVTANTTHVKIGSYAFTASSASGVQVNTVSIIVNPADFLNLGLWVNGTQFGTTQGTVSASGTYSFSGSPFTIAAGATQNVDVYADVISGAVSATPATTLSGCSATSLVSYTAISCSAAGSGLPAGQGLTISGQATVQVAADSANPAAAQVVMGSTGNSLAAFRITETTNVENVKVTDLTVTDVVASNVVTSSTYVKAAFSNLSLYNGTTLLGTAGTAVSSGTTAYNYTFHFGTPIVVPQANSVSLVLKGDAASYASSGANDNTAHSFRVNAPSYVTALGQSSNATSTVSISSANGNTQTVLRSKLTVTASPLGSTPVRSKMTVDDLATLNFAADSAGGVQLNTVVITFSGSATNSSTEFYASGTSSTIVLALYDVANGTTYYASSTVISTGKATFGLANYAISKGTSKNFTLRINTSAGTPAGQSGISQTLSATVSANTDIGWLDSLDSNATTGLGVQSNVIPIQINSVSYAQGT